VGWRRARRDRPEAQPVFKVIRERRRRSVAPGRKFFEALQGNDCKVAGKTAAELPGRCGIILRAMADKCCGVASGERQLACEQLVEDHAEGVDVAGCAGVALE
jgi:hypothetical protein